MFLLLLFDRKARGIELEAQCALRMYLPTITSWTESQTLKNVLRYKPMLKTLDTFGNCQRPVLSLDVSQHMHNITNLWKFEIDWSSELRDNYERKNTLVTLSCVLSDAWFREPQILNLRSRNQIRGELLLSRKQRRFRGSRFSQCFILSTSAHYSLPSEGLY